MSLRRLVLIPFLALLVVLSGCSLLPGAQEPDEPGESEPPAPPAFPVSQFAPIPQQRTTGVDDVINEAAADGDFVVALGWTAGARQTATFRWSPDGGRTWQESDVDPRLRDLTNISHLTKTPDGWWALANGHEGYVALTSKDGQAWAMTKIDDKLLNPARAWFGAVVMTGDMFVAGGTVSPTTGDDEVGFWTSSDGVSWQRSGGRGQGVISAIDVQGDTVVGVGSKNGTGDELTMPAVWRSDDAGASWREQPRPEIGGTDSRFVSFLTGVEAVGQGFVATLQAEDTRGEYRPFSYVSRDGRSWVMEHTPDSMAGTDIDDVRLAADGAVTLLVVNPRIAKSGDKPRIHHRKGGAWQPTELPSGLAGAGEWYVHAVVETGSGLLVFTNRNTANTNTASIWRSTDGATSFTKAQYPAAQADVPVVSPTSFARTQDGYVAVGDSNGLPAIWYGDPDGAFGSATALSTDLDETVSGVAAEGRSVLAWGQQRTLVNSQVLAWHGGLDGLLRPIDAQFEEGGDYAASSVSATRRLDGQWWLVGSTSGNGGRNDSALVLSGTTPQSLRRGVSSRITHRSTGEDDYEVSDLSGNDDVGRGMNDIATGPNGMIAVGWKDNTSGDDSPAYWTRGRDGKWSLRSLPMRDIVTGAASSVVVRGDTIVVSGHGTPRGSDRAENYFWVSNDGGKKWRATLVRTQTPQGGIGRPYPVKDGYIAVGTTGQEDAEPVLYRSADGLDWKTEPLPALRTDPAAQVAGVADYIVEGDKLIMLTWVNSRDGQQSASRIVEHQT